MTPLLPRYYTDMTCYELTTTVLRVDTRDRVTIVTLEDTIFHPQGGGQPADTGTLTSAHGLIDVTHVKRTEDGTIEHVGTIIQGIIREGDVVQCAINQANRILYTRLHSAGHLIDVALEALGIRWKPIKSYHFADGPYVEYQTEKAPHPELLNEVEKILATLIAQDIPTVITLQGSTRIVTLAGKAIPCGGTHVQTLKELGSVHIRSIKQTSGRVKIRYSVST